MMRLSTEEGTRTIASCIILIAANVAVNTKNIA